MARFLNGVAFLTATTGTGTISVGAALSANFLTPEEAGAQNGDNQIPYVITEGTNSERGYGTFSTGDPATFSRDTVLVSKIDGEVGTSKIDLSGSARVRFVAHAEDMVAPGHFHLPQIVTITDEAGPTFDAQFGETTVARLTMAANREMAAPANPVDGQSVRLEVTASGADRTLTLASGTDGFAFGADVTSLDAIASGTTDMIGIVYNETAARWFVVAVAKGF